MILPIFLSHILFIPLYVLLVELNHLDSKCNVYRVTYIRCWFLLRHNIHALWLVQKEKLPSKVFFIASWWPRYVFPWCHWRSSSYQEPISSSILVTTSLYSFHGLWSIGGRNILLLPLPNMFCAIRKVARRVSNLSSASCAGRTKLYGPTNTSGGCHRYGDLAFGQIQSALDFDDGPESAKA